MRNRISPPLGALCLAIFSLSSSAAAQEDVLGCYDLQIYNQRVVGIGEDTVRTDMLVRLDELRETRTGRVERRVVRGSDESGIPDPHRLFTGLQTDWQIEGDSIEIVWSVPGFEEAKLAGRIRNGRLEGRFLWWHDAAPTRRGRFEGSRIDCARARWLVRDIFWE